MRWLVRKSNKRVKLPTLYGRWCIRFTARYRSFSRLTHDPHVFVLLWFIKKKALCPRKPLGISERFSSHSGQGDAVIEIHVESQFLPIPTRNKPWVVLSGSVPVTCGDTKRAAWTGVVQRVVLQAVSKNALHDFLSETIATHLPIIRNGLRSKK